MSGETGAIKLPAVLDLSAAESFLASLLHASEMGEPLVLDASAVESITTPCVQIILSAKRTDPRMIVEAPSEAFLAAFADLGMPWMDAPAASPASVVPPAPPDSDLPEMETEDIQPAAFNPPEVPAESTPEAIQTEMDTTDMAKRILTIDDSKTMRDMLMLTLSDAGYDVVQAVDGQDGIEVLGDRKVDVVITDINMPKMDGYAVIRNLRANPVHKSTPILVLTTESDTEKKNLARDAGATGWMVKPFDPDQLVATIRKVAP
jgi:two-component system, chemotaxis family, chemotaxis protein CheY